MTVSDVAQASMMRNRAMRYARVTKKEMALAAWIIHPVDLAARLRDHVQTARRWNRIYRARRSALAATRTPTPHV